MKVKNAIIFIRESILSHVKNPKLRHFLYGIASFEMMFYVFFGIFTALIDYLVYVSLSIAGMNPLLANIISWICAVIFSFATNRRWVFKMEFDNISDVFHAFSKFVCGRFATLMMTEAMLLLAQVTDLNRYYTKIFAMVLTVIINYILSKLFIFNKDYK